MELLAVLWFLAILIYFVWTSERTRENHLVWMWILMALPVGYWLIKLALAVPLSPVR